MTKRKRKNYRRKRRFMFFIIVVLIVFIVVKNKKEELKTSEDFQLSKSYLRNIENDSGEDIDEKWQKIIVNYLDLYTDSLANLKSRKVNDLFKDKESVEAYLTQATIDLQVIHHSIQINDYRLKNAYYDIKYIDVNKKDNKVIIKFLENDYFEFKFLKDITSRQIDIENEITLIKSNDEYKIESLRVVRDNYVIFTNVLDKNFTKDDIDSLKNKYKKLIREEAINNKNLLEYANNNKYLPSKTCDYSYDREKAVNYSYKYVDKRNDYYSDYSTLGGNCANFASQAIHEGGIPMDYIGHDQWKYYSDYLNEDNEKSGRSTSWVATYYFYYYAKNNSGYGMCADVDINLFYAQMGDVIHVGYKDDTKYSHTTLVSKIIKKDDKVVDILVNSNTTGLKDYPVLGYIYQNKRLIKILGYND